MWASDNQIPDFYVKFYEFSKNANKTQRASERGRWNDHHLKVSCRTRVLSFKTFYFIAVSILISMVLMRSFIGLPHIHYQLLVAVCFFYMDSWTHPSSSEYFWASLEWNGIVCCVCPFVGVDSSYFGIEWYTFAVICGSFAENALISMCVRSIQWKKPLSFCCLKYFVGWLFCCHLLCFIVFSEEKNSNN